MPMFLGFPCGSASKGSACNVGDLGPIPGLGRSPGEGKGYPLQYSGLENSMDPHGVAKSWTHFHFTLHTIWTLLFPITEYLSYHFMEIHFHFFVMAIYIILDGHMLIYF